MSPASASSGEPEIHTAERAADGSDVVERKAGSAPLTREAAIARRQAGGDIVVCGPDTKRNDRVAWEIETAATAGGGKCLYHGPHGGPLSLPHWQQQTPPPEGHSFHETERRPARIVP
jgi:hypothetical protein